MAYQLKIKDETAGGKILNEIIISLQHELVSVSEIISSRVTSEVETYNQRLPDYFQGLVQPDNTEKTLHGYKMPKRKLIDAEQQVYIALDAFINNAYFVLIDQKQAISLDEMVLLEPETEVSFVKLTPLIGG
jgi:hypothetical protein